MFKSLLEMQIPGSHTILVNIDSGCLGIRPEDNFLTNFLGDPEVDGFHISCHIWIILVLYLFQKESND